MEREKGQKRRKKEKEHWVEELRARVQERDDALKERNEYKGRWKEALGWKGSS